jgi:hypothetical protein
VPLNTSGDWRWGRDGRGTPWIESATLLRQSREGDWAPVLHEIAGWLCRLS